MHLVSVNTERVAYICTCYVKLFFIGYILKYFLLFIFLQVCYGPGNSGCKAVVDPGCYQVPTHSPVEVR